MALALFRYFGRRGRPSQHIGKLVIRYATRIPAPISASPWSGTTQHTQQASWQWTTLSFVFADEIEKFRQLPPAYCSTLRGPARKT